MRRRRSLLGRLIFIVIFFLITLILYTMLESIDTNEGERQKTNEERIRDDLDNLEDSIENLNKVINQKRKLAHEQILVNKTFTSKCIEQKSFPRNTTFEIRQLYEKLPFDRPDQGIWPQDAKISYNTSQWTSTNKLKIIVMPHSHCDPGWLNTYEKYFYHVTQYILKTMIEMLDKNPKYKFIWAEMSFLSLWWDRATPTQQDLLRRLISNKQLEIVTGGWVMNDEANTHYFAMIDQLIEGHQFIENKFGNISIKSSWANDPFGYSPTMAYILKNSGIEYLAIQRVHYHIKNALAKQKQFEFLWQQPWDRSQSTRIFTHILPFTGYDIPHTCGPDPKICCQFDFQRALGPYSSCEWGINPIPITDDNIHERAQLLIDQYRQKSQLFRTNILFVQIGDDFRYRTIREAESQFHNYDKLMKYFNEKLDWNINIQYGTLTDYFEELLRDKSVDDFPNLTGDFFTYADRNNDYWSGYYTSRAFFKRMDRIAESYLRATEIAFSFAHIQTHLITVFPKHDFFAMLMKARQNLGLFQHHDGITGTAKEHVVNDYGRKLLDVIRISQIILQQSIAYLLFQENYLATKRMLVLNEAFDDFDRLPKRILLSFENRTVPFRQIFIYNPTDQKRIEIIRILIDTYKIYVTSNEQKISNCQIDPKWFENKNSNIFDENQFELLIRIEIEAYSIKEYTIHRSTNEQSCPLTNIEYIHEQHLPKTSSIMFFNISLIITKDLEISNRYLSILFSKTGAILNLYHKIFDENLRFHTNLIYYGTSKQSDRHGGAYLFVPTGHAQDIPMDNYQYIRIQRGPLIHQVDVVHEIFGLRYRLTNINSTNDQTIQLSVLTYLQTKGDTEFAIRFSTGIKNHQEFFTDLNGFQMIRRKIYDKLPLQGNVYPMPTMSYIEDDYLRFSVLSSQPSGVTCSKSGVIDVFLDRRLTRDDGRGLGQGIMDNRKVISTFKLLFERRLINADRISLTGYPTLLVHHLSLELLYPLHVFHSFSNHVTHQYSFFSKASIFPNDYHLVNFRTLRNQKDTILYSLSKDIAFIVRRFAYDCQENFPETNFQDLFSRNQIESIEQTTLTLRFLKQKLNRTSKLRIPFAEIQTYKIRFL